MTPNDLDALQALADAEGGGGWDHATSYELAQAVPDLIAEVRRLTADNESLAGMVEWMSEVIIDARAAIQRAEHIEPHGSTDWVESGIAMRTTVLREVRAVLDRERNAHPSRYDDLQARIDAALALHADDYGWCPICADDQGEPVNFPCPTTRALRGEGE